MSGAGYTTLTATNGQQAVELSNRSADVILRDVNNGPVERFAATRAIGGEPTTMNPRGAGDHKKPEGRSRLAQMLGVEGLRHQAYTPINSRRHRRAGLSPEAPQPTPTSRCLERVARPTADARGTAP